MHFITALYKGAAHGFTAKDAPSYDVAAALSPPRQSQGALAKSSPRTTKQLGKQIGLHSGIALFNCPNFRVRIVESHRLLRCREHTGSVASRGAAQAFQGCPKVVSAKDLRQGADKFA